ncbi:MAG: hypothetical protein U0169_00910 [Polyangiaceae bacterium]
MATRDDRRTQIANERADASLAGERDLHADHRVVDRDPAAEDAGTTFFEALHPEAARDEGRQFDLLAREHDGVHVHAIAVHDRDVRRLPFALRGRHDRDATVREGNHATATQCASERDVAERRRTRLAATRARGCREDAHPVLVGGHAVLRTSPLRPRTATHLLR